MKGYKVFNSDWTCRKFKYEVGKTYEHKGVVNLCQEGFHFCKKLIDCFNYYSFDPKNKVAEIEAEGEIIEGTDKCGTSKITIIKELTWYEVLDYVNIGKNNTGSCNSGDWNSAKHSNGIFNTEETKIKIFDKESNWTFEDWIDSKSYKILNQIRLTEWIYKEEMTEEEKQKNPDYETKGGYLRKYEYKEACKIMWDKLTEEEKETVMTEIPNFDKDKFYKITGIRI